MVSNNISVSHPSFTLRKQDHNAGDVSEIAEAQKTSMAEMGAASGSRNENLSIPLKPADASIPQPDASTNDCVKVQHAQALSSPRKQAKTEEQEVKTAETPPAEPDSSENGGDIHHHLQMLLDSVMKPTTQEDSPLPESNSSPDMCVETQQREANPAPSVGMQQVGLVPASVMPLSPLVNLQPPIAMQPRYLRREEYLAAAMVCTLADFTNTPNPVVQDAFTHGKYEHLLGYATALDNAGQISTAQEVIILATAQCFRPLGMVCAVDQSFELTANILKHCHALARGKLLRFLKTMLDRAPAAFIPRGEAFIPILDGFAAVTQSYGEVIRLASQTPVEDEESRRAVLERWRVEGENASLAMGILQWLARQPAHWASMNSSQMLLLSLSDLITEPRVDRGIHRMIVDYIALNNGLLPSVDMFIPQNVVLDSIISTFEHAAGREFTSLHYPDFMTIETVSEAEADAVLYATLTIFYHYSDVIPQESLVLARLTELLADLVVGDDVDSQYRGMICSTTKRLFERFPDEFDVGEEFVMALGGLLDYDDCRESAVCMLRIIQQRCGNQEEGMTDARS